VRVEIITSLTGDTNQTWLAAADHLLALADEVLEYEYDPSRGVAPWADLIARIGPAVETYFAQRPTIEATLQSTTRVTIDAADELANWLADLVDVQRESSAEQWKSLLGVQGAVLNYKEKRSPAH